MKCFVIGLLVLLMGLSPQLWTQDLAASVTENPAKGPSEVQQAAKAQTEVAKRGVGEKSRVRVLLKDKSEVEGYISDIGASSFQVTNKEKTRVREIAYGEVEKIRGSGLSRGAKIAIVVGVAGALAGILAATLPKD